VALAVKGTTLCYVIYHLTRIVLQQTQDALEHTFGHLLVAWSGGDEQLCVWDGHIRIWKLEDIRNVVCGEEHNASGRTSRNLTCTSGKYGKERSLQNKPVKLSTLTVPHLPPCGPTMKVRSCDRETRDTNQS
jgi:hypothetical protein